MRIDREFIGKRIAYALDNTIGLSRNLAAEILSVDRSRLKRVCNGVGSLELHHMPLVGSLELHHMPLLVWMTGQDQEYFTGLKEWNEKAVPFSRRSGF